MARFKGTTSRAANQSASGASSRFAASSQPQESLAASDCTYYKQMHNNTGPKTAPPVLLCSMTLIGDVYVTYKNKQLIRDALEMGALKANLDQLACKQLTSVPRDRGTLHSTVLHFHADTCPTTAMMLTACIRYKTAQASSQFDVSVVGGQSLQTPVNVRRCSAGGAPRRPIQGGGG